MIVVEHCLGRGLNGSYTIPRIQKQNEETIIKSTGNCFQNADIANWVSKQGTKEVIIVGQDGMFF